MHDVHLDSDQRDGQMPQPVTARALDASTHVVLVALKIAFGGVLKRRRTLVGVPGALKGALHPTLPIQT